jgi:hypothetical protein
MAEASLLVSGGLKGAAPVFKTFQGNALEQNRAVSPAKENDGAKTLVGCGQTWGDVRVAIVHPETWPVATPMKSVKFGFRVAVLLKVIGTNPMKRSASSKPS